MRPSSFTLEDELNSLLNSHQQRPEQSSSGNLAKIQKVPPYLRNRSEFERYYFPKMVSIGPIHHRPKGEITTKNHLEQGEEYKKTWASKYLQGFNTDDELAWILFVDGCAVLHIMDKVEPSKFQALYIIVQNDLLLLENQLPYNVLSILSNEDDSALTSLTKRFINSFLEARDIAPQSQVINQPAHLLEVLISFIVVLDQTKETTIVGMQQNEVPKYPPKPPTHRNIQELITSGIKIKKNDEKNLTNIYVRGGKLFVPPLTVDDFTAQMFLNMMAYEMCPDNLKSNYEISNYVSFLNSLIDHADDVKVLRKAGVLNNHLGSDEEVAKVFNTVSTDLVLDTGIYKEVRQDIEKIYKRRVRIWFIELQRKHFNTPWTIIGLISAILGFILTIVNLKKQLGSKN
ncbi:UPF0481 protein At3g47200-like isoform X2 [Neltuma alba]|uniref:UPF0481 protein At3g47200-like isoform X2 n=1 Tax=Neltuma alba TaxID=207710 RepID=UPI0010A55290|nr:UPF0481 protein At3g47200-like isoform X2 [Prosopis alba]